jgi:hypothetical protein
MDINTSDGASTLISTPIRQWFGIYPSECRPRHDGQAWLPMFAVYTTIVNTSLTCFIYTAWSVSCLDTLGRAVCDESSGPLVEKNYYCYRASLCRTSADGKSRQPQRLGWKRHVDYRCRHACRPFYRAMEQQAIRKKDDSAVGYRSSRV